MLNPASDNLKLFINNIEFGTYAYNEGAILIENLAADCATLLSIKLTDSQETSCSIEDSLDEPICCIDPDCTISNTVLSSINCITNSDYTLTIDLEHTGVSSNNFELYKNGVLANTYTYDQLPLNFTEKIEQNHKQGQPKA